LKLSIGLLLVSSELLGSSSSDYCSSGDSSLLNNILVGFLVALMLDFDVVAKVLFF